MSENRPEGFSIIPNHLLGLLSAFEIAVYVAVRSYYPNPYPSHAALAERAGMSVSTLQRTLNGMRAKGLLAWEQQQHERGGQSSNRYALSDEAPRNTNRPVGQSDRPPRSDRPTPSVRVTDEEEQSKKINQSRQRPVENSMPPPMDDLIDESKNSSDEARQFLRDLEPITGLSFQPHARSLAAARHAIRGGYTPGTALDAIAGQGHDLGAAGAGLILQLLERLPIRITRDPWRDNLPGECGHPEAAQIDYNPALCLQCRAEAGDPYAVRTMVERLAAAKRIPA